MGINISQKQLQGDDFICMMKNLIKSDSFRSIWIDAEITENILSESDSASDKAFKALKELNVSISVDNFGSGFSSWRYLSKFPFDRIKIDQSLIEQLSAGDDNSIRMVQAVVSTAEAMGIKAIAEGVETQEQLEILKRLKCRQAQGYWLGRPVPAGDFESLFIKNSVSL
jgi:EAL domain-containing protein (putative c-di-GMP-specific phosphodiesterase class I)